MARRAGSCVAFEGLHLPTRRLSPSSLERLGRLAEDLPEVVELDLNPVIAGERGCVVVDARIRVRVRETAWALKSW